LKLFVERSQVKLKPVPGEVHFFNYEDKRLGFRSPMMKDRKGEYEGFSSGVRGAIVQKGPTWFRIKGCGCGIDNVQLQQHLGTPEPEGGQLQEAAEGELKVLKMVNEALKASNIPNSVEPWGRFDYRDFKLFDDQCSASVYKIRGDTRADEFVLHLFEEHLKKPEYFKDEVVGKNICTLMENMGRYTSGVVKAVYDCGITWNIAGTGGTNAHVGNLVIYEDDSPFKIRVGITDFDGQTTENIWKTRVAHKLGDEKAMKEYASIIDKEIDNLRGTMFHGIGAATISGAQIPIIPLPWLKAFDKGFVDAYNGAIHGKELTMLPVDFDCDRVFRKIVASSLQPRGISHGGFSRLYDDFRKDYGLGSIYNTKSIGYIDDYMRGGRDIIKNYGINSSYKNFDVDLCYNRKNDYSDGIGTYLDRDIMNSIYRI
jgi:hypothetical protein